MPFLVCDSDLIRRQQREAEEADVVVCHEGIALAAHWLDVPMVLETDCAMVADKLKSDL
jgi:hypothetical protein